MRIAIRDLGSKLFFNQGQWTTSSKRAQCFPDRKAVERMVFEFNIRKAEMVFMDDSFCPIGGAFIPLAAPPCYEGRQLEKFDQPDSPFPLA